MFIRHEVVNVLQSNDRVITRTVSLYSVIYIFSLRQNFHIFERLLLGLEYVVKFK